MEKIITKSKLAYFWNKVLQLVSHKVDKEAGKGLSTNDFTDEYKDKIDNGATPDWKQSDETQPGYIKNRTHWVEYDEPTTEETLPETTLEFELYGGIDYSVIDGALREEAKLIINIDGTVYEATTRRLRDSYGDYMIEAGNENLPQGDKEGVPFYLCSYVNEPEYGIWLVILSSNPEEYGVEEHTVSITSIYQEKTYIPLDDRYIPEYEQKWENIVKTPFSAYEDSNRTIRCDQRNYSEYDVYVEEGKIFRLKYRYAISPEECSGVNRLFIRENHKNYFEDYSGDIKFTFNEDGFGYYYDPYYETVAIVIIPYDNYMVNDILFLSEGLYILDNSSVSILAIEISNLSIAEIESTYHTYLNPIYIPDYIKLPIVDIEDNGKILQVNEDGEWTPTLLSNSNPTSYFGVCVGRYPYNDDPLVINTNNEITAFSIGDIISVKFNWAPYYNVTSLKISDIIHPVFYKGNPIPYSLINIGDIATFMFSEDENDIECWNLIALNSANAGLPIVDSMDNGKVLQVIDGVWEAAENTSDVQIEVDSELSDTSTNPVANNVIKEALDTKADKTELEELATEQYVNSAVSGKQNTITGAATTITSSNLTANRALISNGSGKVAVSDITNTELNYLDGVTSNIQTQLNNKANASQLNGLATEAYVQEQLGNVSFDESLLDSKADKYAPTIESRIDIEAEQIPTIFMKSNNGVNTRQFLIEGNTNQGGGLTFGPSADDTYTNRRYLSVFDPVSAPNLQDGLQFASIENGVFKGYNVFHSGVGGVFGGIAQADAESQKLLGHPQLRNITISDVDLVAGESELPEGIIYLVYK